jgi:hypothetical protein
MTLTTTDLMQEKSIEAFLVDGKYPHYETIFPKGQPAASIMVNAKYLKEMADYFAKHGEGDKVLIEIYDDGSPVVFKGETAGVHQQVRGLVMPLRMSEARVVTKETAKMMEEGLQGVVPGAEVTVEFNPGTARPSPHP